MCFLLYADRFKIGLQYKFYGYRHFSRFCLHSGKLNFTFHLFVEKLCECFLSFHGLTKLRMKANMHVLYGVNCLVVFWLQLYWLTAGIVGGTEYTLDLHLVILVSFFIF